MFGAAIARELGLGFVPARKPGKLPGKTERISYGLEYGSNVLEVHVDAFSPGEPVLIVDDVLATGGTAAAAAELVERLGARVTGLTFCIELADLKGRSKLSGRPSHAVLVL
jgi:adenine phosphoribosyltransferase